MKRISAHSITDEFCNDPGAALLCELEFLEDQDPRAFANNKAIAILVTRPRPYCTPCPCPCPCLCPYSVTSARSKITSTNTSGA